MSSFKHLYSLIDQLAQNDEQTTLIEQIRTELKSLEQQVNSQSQTLQISSINPQLLLDKATNCYTDEEQSVFYCPHCYEKDKSRAPTQRINRKVRICSQCRSSIKANPSA